LSTECFGGLASKSVAGSYVAACHIDLLASNACLVNENGENKKPILVSNKKI